MFKKTFRWYHRLVTLSLELLQRVPIFQKENLPRIGPQIPSSWVPIRHHHGHHCYRSPCYQFKNGSAYMLLNQKFWWFLDWELSLKQFVFDDFDLDYWKQKLQTYNGLLLGLVFYYKITWYISWVILINVLVEQNILQKYRN